MNFEETLKQRTQEAQAILSAYLPAEEGFQKTVLEAMNYSVLAGGKRLRPVLMRETFFLFGGQGEVIEPFMAALEMIHSYSLVHDDLPAMDNDEYRRGRQTTWRVYGEGMAVLAGDGLLNYAYETAGRVFDLLEKRRSEAGGQNAGEEQWRAAARALQVLAQKAGVYGMVGGQCADILAENRRQEEVTEELLFYIHKNKTAALIESAMMIGAILADASEEQIGRMERVAEDIGLAFQIQDDILDVIGDQDMLGKPVGSDEKNHKTTYVTLKGVKAAQEEADRLTKEALAMLRSFGQRNLFLEELVEALMHREK